MRKLSGILLVCVLSSSGCAALNPLDVLTPNKPSVELNANVGKNVEQEKNNIKVEQGNTDQTAETISNDTEYKAGTINQITQNIPMEYLLLIVILAGWVIPSPKECWNGTKGLTSEVLNAIIVVPVKGLANFILALFNRQMMP